MHNYHLSIVDYGWNELIEPKPETCAYSEPEGPKTIYLRPNSDIKWFANKVPIISTVIESEKTIVSIVDNEKGEVVEEQVFDTAREAYEYLQDYLKSNPVS